MLHTILVPLDGSDFAEHALPLAITLGRRGAAVHLVRVHLRSGEHATARLAELDDLMHKVELQYLEQLLERLARSGASLTFSVADGSVVSCLEEAAEAQRADLIVMTTHGRTGMSRAWIGSVADQLMRRSTVPVLLLRPTSKPADPLAGRELGSILVPLDGSPRAEEILEHAADLADMLGARITLLNVIGPVILPMHPYAYIAVPLALDRELLRAQTVHSDAYLRSIAERLRSRHPGLEVRKEVQVAENAAAGILERARSASFDLVAMTTRAHGLSRLLVGGVADKVMRGTRLPLLLYSPPEEEPDTAAGSEEERSPHPGAITTPERPPAA
ncbi:MAG TPA: universal stress protein [Gemmatimonadaceae bacterium]|nr:universal stress protein [Gemmatimonadaceae bacterium]